LSAFGHRVLDELNRWDELLDVTLQQCVVRSHDDDHVGQTAFAKCPHDACDERLAIGMTGEERFRTTHAAGLSGGEHDPERRHGGIVPRTRTAIHRE
jgi:hypothetical protein